jgi:hypothetical protein
MALSPGTRLGSYEIADQIGLGGMGEVYRATDTNLKRAVAIVAIRPWALVLGSSSVLGPWSVLGPRSRVPRVNRENAHLGQRTKGRTKNKALRPKAGQRQLKPL